MNRISTWALRTIKAVLLVFLILILVSAAFFFSYRETVPNISEDQSPNVGVTTSDFADAIDRSRQDINAVRLAKNYPSVSISVFREGREVWSEAIGYEDISSKTPATPETLYPFGSIGKSMTAALVMQLVAEGIVDLDAPISRYAPTLPQSHGSLTLRQLLSHQAGVRHYELAFIPPFFTENGMDREFSSSEESLTIFIDDPLLFEPDSSFEYTTYGYTLIGYVLEEATGTPFLDLIRERLFAPMSLDTIVPDRSGPQISGRTTDYMNLLGGLGLFRTPKTNVSYKWAGGGFLSTPSDVAKFGDAMLLDKIITPEAFAEMASPRRLFNGEVNPQKYGLGWRSGTVAYSDSEQQTPIIHHGGTAVGAECALMLLPEFLTSVAICGNAFTGGSGDLVQLAADVGRNFQRNADR